VIRKFVVRKLRAGNDVSSHDVAFLFGSDTGQ
jgi:hypothetical protein